MPAAASSRPGLVAGTAPASQQTAVAAPPAQPAQPPSRPASPAQPGQTAAPASTESAHRDWAAAATLTHTHTTHSQHTVCHTRHTAPCLQPRGCVCWSWSRWWWWWRRWRPAPSQPPDSRPGQTLTPGRPALLHHTHSVLSMRSTATDHCCCTFLVCLIASLKRIYKCFFFNIYA